MTRDLIAVAWLPTAFVVLMRLIDRLGLSFLGGRPMRK